MSEFGLVFRARARRVLAGVVGVVALSQVGCREAVVEAPPTPPSVGVVESRRMDVPVEVSPNGTARALENVTIRARVRGFLTERHFEEGAVVRKGDLLFVIDERPYQIALDSAKARLAEAQAELRRARESKAREVSAARVALDRAQLGLARITERRSRALVHRNAGSAEELDKSEAERKRWESQVEADLANLHQAESDFDIGIAAAQAQVAAAEAAVGDAALNLGYCRMYAPLNGRIGEALVKVGNLVGPDPSGGGALSDLATIQQLDPIGVDLWLSSRDLDRITTLIESGLAVRLVRSGPSGPEEYAEEGRCYFIDNRVDETTSTFLVKARVPNAQGKLLPGEYVKVRMVVNQLQHVVVVPASSVIESSAGTIVHVVDHEGKVAVRKVEAGQTFEGLRVIARGLDAGVPVIVDGLQMIRPGLAVKAEPVTLARRNAPERGASALTAADSARSKL